MKNSEYPVIKCFEVGKSAIFWCPFCQCWHRHGAGAALEGHRGAHCVNETPFTTTGYILKKYTKKELKEIAEGIAKC